ncbi:ATP-binding protein [Streptomyces sp. A73]|nr:ATP-binding protein [Streptomyces sp. A73]
MESRGGQLTGVVDEAPPVGERNESLSAVRSGVGTGAVGAVATVLPLRERTERQRRSAPRTLGCGHEGSPGGAHSTAPGPAQGGAWRFTAPTTASSVPRLRHAVRDLLERQPAGVPAEVLQGALLILSELVTNAVQHAALLSPEIAVEVALDGGWLRVAVEDSHPYRPKALEAEPFREHTGGRGLLLVKTLTFEAGGVCDVEQTSTGGKVVWAALPLSPEAAGADPRALR